MSYTYEVQKRRSNRVAYRILAAVFLTFSVLQFIVIIRGYSNHPMLAGFFSTAVFLYGLYLLKNSFRKTAFNIIYRFDDEYITIKHHYGESKYTYDDVDCITMVTADPNMIFCVLNLKIKKDIYAIPFTMKKDYCERVYEFVNAKIKHDD